MHVDTNSWVQKCKRCKTTENTYVEPSPLQGFSTTNNPLDLVCMDFTKPDPNKDRKENVSVTTDASSEFTEAMVTPNQKTQTAAKKMCQ